MSTIIHKITDEISKKIAGNIESTLLEGKNISAMYISAKLSSRPLSWCRYGIDQTSRIRAFKANSGNV